jgi:hypothetical protein
MSHHAVLLAAALVAFAFDSIAGPNAAARFYADDPGDLWNRVHAALLVRTNAQGEVYADLVDPPLWFRTKHLLDDASCARTTRLLEEFCRDDHALKARTPAQRAFMQRDLIGVLAWLLNGHRGDNGVISPAQRQFARALARAIRHVALDAPAIRQLPSNATADGAPAAFDPARPDQAFLPEDLLAEDGPWIALQPQDGASLAAPVHFKFFCGRSSFEVRFYHPAGRAAGEAYLEALNGFPKPLVFEKPGRGHQFAPEEGPWLNPATPVFPANAAWALVRRAILADRDGRPVLSPVVESVQIRVYRRTDRSLTASPDTQAFGEWHFTRDFLRGEPGLRPASLPIGLYTHHFMSKQFDPFEEGWKLPEAGSPQAQFNCFTCHNSRGLESVHSRSRMFELGMVAPPAQLQPVSFERIAEIAGINARQQPFWQVLPFLAFD